MRYLFSVLAVLLIAGVCAASEEVPLSGESRSCIGCHQSVTPGIVADWRTSRHAWTTPRMALAKDPLKRRVSAAEVPEALAGNAVGCFECHGRNTDRHEDSFSHYGFTINVVVSAGDCSLCHPVEVEQYTPSKKGYAYRNIEDNPVYHSLIDTVIGLKEVDGTEIASAPPSESTRHDACFSCHGTKVEVRGLKTVQGPYGPLEVPDLSGWPNQGVGRLNPDGTRGACTSCHPRHAFSIEVARKPYTCAQCHLEPDVPAWNIYFESKHGNIFESSYHEWDFQAVPWEAGTHFTAPTCATCHASLITAPGGRVIAERSHDFASRLWVRLFGLIYTHPQPISGDTTIIRNADGAPVPTTATGAPASEYLIDEAEQQVRYERMTAVCTACHNSQWVAAHFRKMDKTLAETDAMTRAATQLLMKAWETGVADEENPFDEPIEQKWVKQWLFYGNTARYASAMTGAPDYIAFKYGWWGLTTNLAGIRESLELKLLLKGLSEPAGRGLSEPGETESPGEEKQ